MALWQAYQLCPHLIILPPDFGLYTHMSSKLRAIYMDYSPYVESYGLDECWIDYTSQGITLADGKILADILRRRARDELDICLSVGVSFNKVFAKLASDYKKPDATTIVTPDNYRSIVWPLPISDLLNVGPKTVPKLYSHGIHTIGELARTDPALLRSLLGKAGFMHYSHANGLDDSPVIPIGAEETIKSIGNSTTTHVDMTTVEDVACVYSILAEQVGTRLREKGLMGNCVHISIRDTSLRCAACQQTVSPPTALASEIERAAMQLFNTNGYAAMLPLRSIGVSVSNLQSLDAPAQLDFMNDHRHRDRHLAIARCIDGLNARFDTQMITRGNTMVSSIFSAMDHQNDHTIQSLPS